MLDPVDVASAVRGEKARRKVAATIGRVPGCRLVLDARHGREAAEALATVRAPIAVLDLALPILSGADVLETLPPEKRPIPIFLARAADDPELAFEHQATGFLKRPLSSAALERALTRAVTRLNSTTGRQRDPLSEIAGGFPLPTVSQRRPGTYHLTVSTLDGPKVVSVDQIDWIEAADYCVRLHVAGRAWLLRQSLSALENRLDPRIFLRTHRSAIVNLDRIIGSRGRRLVLRDGKRVPVSRSRRTVVERRLLARGCRASC